MKIKYHSKIMSPTEEIEWQEAMDRIHEDAAVLWDKQFGHLNLPIVSVWGCSDGSAEISCESTPPNFFRLYHGPGYAFWVHVQDGVGTSGRRTCVTDEFVRVTFAERFPHWLHGQFCEVFL